MRATRVQAQVTIARRHDRRQNLKMMARCIALAVDERGRGDGNF
jgi:hypothetical protein